MKKENPGYAVVASMEGANVRNNLLELGKIVARISASPLAGLISDCAIFYSVVLPAAIFEGSRSICTDFP